MYASIKKHSVSSLLLLGLLLLIAAAQGFGQATTVVGTGRSVKVGAYPRVHLRWLPAGDTLPSSASQPNYYLNAWSRYKKDGYTIKRRKLNASNVVIPTVELTYQSFPDSVKLFQASAGTGLGPDGEAAGVLYGALYDQVETGPAQINGKDIQTIDASGVDEREQRYALTVVGAEQSFPSAMLAGLAWVDTTALVGATYEYEITEAASPGQTSRSVKVTVKNTYVAPSAPQSPKVLFGDRKALLRWRWFLPNISPTSTMFQNVYNSYFVEMSTTSSTTGFVRMNARPIMSLNENSDSLYFEIPLAANGVTTYVRTGAVSPYGEVFRSSVITGKGVDTPAVWLPRIDSTSTLGNGSAVLRWVFPSDTVLSQANALLNGFEIHRSGNMENFQKLTIGSTSLFNSATRQVTLPPAVAQGYYIVNAKYKTGQTVSSNPVLIQRVDSFPPAVPTGLQAFWDSQYGRMRLNWTANIESDLMGYKVFRANLAGEEPALLGDVRGATTFLDIEMRINNPRAWYYVLAYDQRFNQSRLSSALVVVKPDLIAPDLPNFLDWRANPEGVDLSWSNSVSRDVATQTLTRKLTGSPQPGTVLRTWSTVARDSAYTDRTIPAKGRYSYTIQAVDSSGNTSRDSVLIDVTSLGGARPPVADFTAVSDPPRGVHLTWACQGKEVVEFEIRRTITDSAPSFAPNSAPSAAPNSAPSLVSVDPVWKTVDGLFCEMWDREERTGEHQRVYRLVAVYSDGTKSPETAFTIQLP